MTNEPDTCRKQSSSAMPVSRTMQGTGTALSRRLAFTGVEGAIAPAAGRDLVEAGFFAVRAYDGANIEVLQQAAVGNVLRQFLDREAGLYRADVEIRGSAGRPVAGVGDHPRYDRARRQWQR